jgi:uncharacterized phage protein (predicted DNA packaging)
MAVELSDIKNYLRIDHDVDDTFLTSLIETAKAFVEEKTGVKYIAGDNVYELAIKCVVAHFYDKRESVTDKEKEIVPYTMDCLLAHIGVRGSLSDD